MIEIVNITKNHINYIKKTQKNIKNHASARKILAIVSVFMFTILTSAYVMIFAKDTRYYTTFNNLITRNMGMESIIDEVCGVKESELHFALPIKTTHTEVHDGYIKMTMTEDNVVRGMECGYVKKIGENNLKQRYIELQHTDKLSSVIYGVDVIGVGVGQYIKKGDLIGTLEKNNTLIIKLFKQGSQIIDVNVVDNHIIWAK